MRTSKTRAEKTNQTLKKEGQLSANQISQQKNESTSLDFASHMTRHKMTSHHHKKRQRQDKKHRASVDDRYTRFEGIYTSIYTYLMRRNTYLSRRQNARIPSKLRRRRPVVPALQASEAPQHDPAQHSAIGAVDERRQPVLVHEDSQHLSRPRPPRGVRQEQVKVILSSTKYTRQTKRCNVFFLRQQTDQKRRTTHVAGDGKW